MIRASHVDIDSGEYRRNHGASPRGRGNWAFCATNAANQPNYPADVFWFNGTFGTAKKVAAAYFAAKGVPHVTVLS